MPCDNWWIITSILLVALAFVALVVFLVMTLLSLRHITNDVDEKMRSFDPLFRIASKLCSKAERRVSNCCEEEEESSGKEAVVDSALEVAQWVVLGLALWQKLNDRRKS